MECDIEYDRDIFELENAIESMDTGYKWRCVMREFVDNSTREVRGSPDLVSYDFVTSLVHKFSS